MHIRVGYELQYDFPQPTPIIANLNVHYSRASDIVQPDQMRTMPPVPISAYRDGFGNWCTRLVAPSGLFTITADKAWSDWPTHRTFLPTVRAAATSIARGTSQQ